MQTSKELCQVRTFRLEAARFLQIAVDYGKVAKHGAERIRSMRSDITPEEDAVFVKWHASIAMDAKQSAAGLLSQDLSALSITGLDTHGFIRNLIEQAAYALFNPQVVDTS